MRGDIMNEIKIALTPEAPDDESSESEVDCKNHVS